MNRVYTKGTLRPTNLKPPTDLGPLYPDQDDGVSWYHYLIAAVIFTVVAAWLGQWMVDKLGL